MDATFLWIQYFQCFYCECARHIQHVVVVPQKRAERSRCDKKKGKSAISQRVSFSLPSALPPESRVVAAPEIFYLDTGGRQRFLILVVPGLHSLIFFMWFKKEVVLFKWVFIIIWVVWVLLSIHGAVSFTHVI